MSDKTIYVGSGKEGMYGVNISICLTDLPKEFITESKNGKKYINLKVNPLKATDKYGKTHSVSVDTWKPEKKEGQVDDLPF